MELAGTVALVTGASSGIGQALAVALAGADCRVVLFARRAMALEQLGLAIGTDRCTVVVGDVTQRADLDHAVAVAVERFGRLDILVNNAGFGIYGPILTLDEAGLDAIWRTNVLGPLLGIQAAAPQLIANQGIVVNMSSIVSKFAGPGWAAYGSSKAALNLISATLRAELKDHGVRVLNVFPGLTDTGFMHAAQYTEDSPGARKWRDTVPQRTAADAAQDVVRALQQDLQNWSQEPFGPSDETALQRPNFVP